MGGWLKTVVLVGLILALVAGLAAAWAWQRYETFLDEPLRLGEDGMTLRVQPGEPVTAVIRHLERQGATTLDWRWRLLLRREPVTIQVGEYALVAGTDPRGLLGKLAAGDVIQYRFTLVEGWNYRQLVGALMADERLAVAPEQLTPEAVLDHLDLAAPHPEGWFLPETYAFTAFDDALTVLERAHAAMRLALEQAWSERVDGLPLSDPYELLILASIVEKESALAAERPDIAGVFVRRLQQNWRLETDPTVIYGMGERYDGNIRRRDLREDTPWNTYVHRGLPPTPIAMPGPGALQAAARPAEGAAMFFVADGQGGHVFSETLEAHNRAVRDLVRRQRGEGGGQGGGSEKPEDGAP
ncbi:MAG: endolytic transglycosylase MltG [Xanthomonadales bacterium]|jgi:UPF0755 protein|nr:endolytic transglycosylase MltG [Xanthomonadales bacterium]